jgi:hypothetical protein
MFDNINQKRFILAKAAPICSGNLQKAFGYKATTGTATSILARTYEYPLYFDQATREICEDCARIWRMILKDLIHPH